MFMLLVVLTTCLCTVGLAVALHRLFGREKDGSPVEQPMAPYPLPRRRAASHILKPLRLRGLVLRNRVIRAAAFGGSSLQAMHDTHEEVAKGGVGMTTLAYCCVSDDGRTFASQLVLTRLSQAQRDALLGMTSAVHAHGAAASVQLTHAGGFANHEVIGQRQMAPSATFSPGNLRFSAELTAADLDRLDAAFAESASVAKAVGFDCVELHCGHGYLLSQFLSPSHNTRGDAYGGTRDRRFAFPLRVLASIRSAVGDTFPIAVKFNVDDGFKSGLTLPDACAFARACNEAGADLLVPSCGYVDRNGFHMLRGAVPLWDMVKAMPGLVEKIALALFGKWLVPAVPFRRQFLLEQAKAILEAVRGEGEGEGSGNPTVGGGKGKKTQQQQQEEGPIAVALLGGVRSWSGMEEAIGKHGFACVQTARTLIRDPDFVLRIEERLRRTSEEGDDETGGWDRGAAAADDDAAVVSGEIEDIVSRCTNCNACVVATLAEGKIMRCVERNPAITSSSISKQ